MKRAIILAALAWAVLFLLPACSTMYSVSRTNWKGSTYVVDTQSVDSLRQMYRDAGYQIFGWRQYTRARLARLNKSCRTRIGAGSKFVGDIETPDGKLSRFCTFPVLYPPMAMVYICTQIGKYMGVPMGLRWARPKELKFACERVPSTEIRRREAPAIWRNV